MATFRPEFDHPVVAVQMPAGKLNETIQCQLKSNGCDLCMRGGFLCASPHLYSAESDVEEPLDRLSLIASKAVLGS